jgi:hypothetical protein
MKKVLLFCAVIFAFAACAPKENKEAAASTDSVAAVVDTVAPVDTVAADTAVAPAPVK